MIGARDVSQGFGSFGRQRCLIVRGSHGGCARLRIGSDTAEVLAESPVPVLLVRAPPVSTEHVEIEPRVLNYASGEN